MSIPQYIFNSQKLPRARQAVLLYMCALGLGARPRAGTSPTVRKKMQFSALHASVDRTDLLYGMHPSSRSALQDVLSSRSALQDVPSSKSALKDVPSSRTALQDVPSSRSARQDVLSSRSALQDVPSSRSALQDVLCEVSPCRARKSSFSYDHFNRQDSFSDG